MVKYLVLKMVSEFARLSQAAKIAPSERGAGPRVTRVRNVGQDDQWCGSYVIVGLDGNGFSCDQEYGS